MPNIGPTELIILLVIILVIFGPKRLPGLGKQLGGGMKDFKEALTSRHDSDDEDDDTVTRPALTKASTPESDTPAAPATPVASTPERSSGQDA